MDTGNPQRSERNIVVDIETLDTQPSAVILSLGAYCLETGGEWYSEFAVDQPGRTISGETALWWLRQEIAAPVKGWIALKTGLKQFFEFYCDEFKGTAIWSNGTDFDITIIAHAAKQFQLALPWAYNDVRDYRTLRKLFPTIIADPFEGEKHHAMDDARYEGLHLQKLLAHINSTQP